MILEDDVVRLEPVELSDCMDYLLELIMKCHYTKISRDEARQALSLYPLLLWNGYDKKTNTKIGIVYITKTDKYWTLDAYKDDELAKSIDNTMDYSYRAGKLVSDYALTLTDTLLTCHAFENRGATLVCKRLGFKENFIILKKERNYGG